MGKKVEAKPSGKTNTDFQREFRERMIAAGYKSRIIWVPRDVKETESLTQASFLKKLDKITEGWTKWKTSLLYQEFLCIAKSKKSKT